MQRPSTCWTCWQWTKIHPRCQPVAIDSPTCLAETLGMIKEPEAGALMAVIDRLAERFPDRPRSAIEEIVAEEHELLDDGPIRDYVPVLVERASKLRLARP